jgi:hypothetical protein
MKKKKKLWEGILNYIQRNVIVKSIKGIIKIIIKVIVLLLIMILMRYLMENLFIIIQKLSVRSFIEENEKKYLKELTDSLLIEKIIKKEEEKNAEELRSFFYNYILVKLGFLGFFYIVKGLIGKHYHYDSCVPEADASTIMADLNFDLVGETLVEDEYRVVRSGRFALVRRWSHFLKVVPDNYIPEMTVKEVTKIILNKKFGDRGYLGIIFPTKEDERRYIQAVEALMKRKILGLYSAGLSSRLREFVKRNFEVEDAIRSLVVVDWLEKIYDKIDKYFFIEFLLWVMLTFYSLAFFIVIPEIGELDYVLQNIDIIESYIEGYKINYNLVKELSMVIFKGYWGYISEYDKLVAEVLTRNNVFGNDRDIYITIMDRLYIDKFILKK